MVLPQSSTAFRTLRDRLTSVSSLHIALGQLVHSSGTDALPASTTSAALRSGVDSGKRSAPPTIAYGPLLSQFTEVQAQCTAAKRAELRAGHQRAVSAVGRPATPAPALPVAR